MGKQQQRRQNFFSTNKCLNGWLLNPSLHRGPQRRFSAPMILFPSSAAPCKQLTSLLEVTLPTVEVVYRTWGAVRHKLLRFPEDLLFLTC